MNPLTRLVRRCRRGDQIAPIFLFAAAPQQRSFAMCSILSMPRKSTKANDAQESSGNKGQQNNGFASMPKEEVREIASKGGRSSRKSNEEEDVSGGEVEEHHQKSKKGFANMPKEKLHDIAVLGGHMSHHSGHTHDPEVKEFEEKAKEKDRRIHLEEERQKHQ